MENAGWICIIIRDVDPYVGIGSLGGTQAVEITSSVLGLVKMGVEPPKKGTHTPTLSLVI